MKPRPSVPAWIAVVYLVTAAPARADWFSEGVRVAVSDTVQSDPVLASDQAGGAFIVWQDYRSGSSAIFAQHLTADGSPASGWPVAGTQVSTTPEYDPVIVTDSRGGAFVAATNGGSIGLWHLPSGPVLGSLQPIARLARPHEARPVDAQKTSPTVLPVLLPDGDGGVFLAWEQGGHLSEYVEVQHFAADGHVVSPWPASDLFLGYGHAPVICSDGASGVFVAAQGVSVRHVAVRPDTVLADWPDWVFVTPAPHGYQDAPGIVSDGAGGALVFWQDPRQAGYEQTYAQRLTAAGTVAQGWPADGLPVCSYSTDAGLTRYSAGYRTQRYTVVASDGGGGAFIAWRDMRTDGGDVYLQHLLSVGSLAEGWTQNGLPVCRIAGIQTAPSIAPDGSGGVFVCWQDQRPGSTSQAYVQHILASGAVDPVWPSGGAIACSDPSDRFLPRLIADPAQGPLLAWEDTRFFQSAIFATHLREDGGLAPVGPCYVGVSVISTAADSGTIHIVWQLTHADTVTATLYCRQIDGPWMPITRRGPDSSGRIDYADREGIAGCRYGYALGIRTCDGPEQILGIVWIDVPQARGFPSLSASPSESLSDGGPLQLTWHIPGAEGLTAIVSRRDSCSGWTDVDTVGVTETDEVSYEERSFFEGHSIGYRVVVHACGRDNIIGESWVSIPAGHGFIPTAATLTRATADAAGAHLGWQMQSGPPSRARIYRRSSSSTWSQVREYPMVPNQTIEFDDLALQPGTRYEYCLGLWSCGVEPIFGMAVVHTPASVHAPVALALRGGWPNPSRSGLTLSFALESAEPAWLELFDAAGRMVISQSVGSLGPGDHVLTLDGSKLGRGLYVVRLTQAGHTLSARVSLLH